VLIPIGLLFAYLQFRFAGLLNPDALDYAQLGSDLASGRGFSTFILCPLALTHGGDPLHQPAVRSRNPSRSPFSSRDSP
jgi:hypothetical protein